MGLSSLFSKNKQIGSEEYEKVSKRIVEINTLLEELRTKIQVLETNMNSLRGLINRKVGGFTKDEAESEKYNNSVILPEE